MAYIPCQSSQLRRRMQSPSPAGSHSVLTRLLANRNGVIDVAATTPAARLGAAGGRFQRDMDSGVAGRVETRARHGAAAELAEGTVQGASRWLRRRAERELELNLGEGGTGQASQCGCRAAAQRCLPTPRCGSCLCLESVQTGTAERKITPCLSPASAPPSACCAACCAKLPNTKAPSSKAPA
jgi:hypothetical protein